MDKTSLINAVLSQGAVVYKNGEYHFTNKYIEVFPQEDKPKHNEPKEPPIKQAVVSAVALMDSVIASSCMPYRVKNLTGSTYTVRTKTTTVKSILHNMIVVKKTCTKQEAIDAIKEYYQTTDLPKTLHKFFAEGLFTGMLEERASRVVVPGMQPTVNGKIERKML